jgi:hypothetical protein
MADERHGAYVRDVQEAAQRCGHELLAENERLRSQVARIEAQRLEAERRLREAAEGVRTAEALRALAENLEAEKLRFQQRLLEATAELDLLRRERAAFEEQLVRAEIENQHAADEYTRAEQRSANLANLYVASYQLHESLDRAAVLAAIREIIANLIGSEEFALLERRPDAGGLALTECCGIAPERIRDAALQAGPISRVADTGEIFIAQPDGPTSDLPLTACIPLKTAGRVTGVIAIFRLLAHKAALAPIDHELFDLLATQAGTSLYCTRLHEVAESRGWVQP